MDDATPLTASEFSDLLLPMKPAEGERVAVAVSGGADSLALTVMMGEYCTLHNISLTALTVDHGLRAEAAEEVRQVARWLEEYNIAHVTLNWQGDKPHSNIQEQARVARYKLMGEWCRKNNVSQLFLAHHLDDQAETFLIRLFRGSGVDGLSAMKPQSGFPVPLPDRGKITICRPLLSVAKVRLESTLHHMNQLWTEDPSNQNESYMRVKVRNLLRESDIEGLDVNRMAGTAARMGRVQSLLQSLMVELTQECVTGFVEGYAEVRLSSLLAAHEEIALRCLASLLRMLGGGKYVPRLKRLEAFYDKLKSGDFSGQTLGGCLISPLANNRIMISREGAAICDTACLEKDSITLWDSRFIIENKTTVGLLKKLELSEWQKICCENPKLEKLRFPKVVRDSLPCIIMDNGKVILPTFIPGFDRSGFTAVLQQHFVNDLAVK